MKTSERLRRKIKKECPQIEYIAEYPTILN